MTRPEPSLALSLLGLGVLALSCEPIGSSDPEPPPVPSRVVAVAGNQSVTLDWQRSDETRRYDLYWSAVSAEYNPDQALRNVLPPKVHRNRINGVRLFYRVVAINEAGENWSEEVSALPDLRASAPGAPSNVSTTAGDSQVALAWGYVTEAQYYTVYRSTNAGDAIDNGVAFVAASNPFVDTGLVNGLRYHYVVTATTGDGEGPQSAEVNSTPQGPIGQAPDAPTGLTATAGDGHIQLSWNSDSEASTHTLYFSTSPGVTPISGTALGDVSSPYTHTGLSNDTTYYYVVVASNAHGSSPPSSEAQATPSAVGPPPQPPAAPTALSASAGDGQVSLSWTPSSGATQHTLYYATSPGVSPGSGTPLASATSPYNHGGLSNGTTYYYVVTASNAQGESAASAQVSATPEALVQGHGSIVATLPGGVHAIVLFEHLTSGDRVLQVQVLNGGAEGTPIDGLAASLSGAVSGTMNPLGSGTYRYLSAGTFAPGSYNISLSGSLSGTVETVVHDVPACSIDQPTAAATLPVSQDLTLMWTAVNTDQVLVSFMDSLGQVVYPAVGPPDPGGVLVPGSDLSNTGEVTIQVSAAWKLETSNAHLLYFGDCNVNVVLQ